MIDFLQLLTQKLQPLPDRTWFFQTRKHFKIWFSKNPEVFLPMEDQLRFINMWESGPVDENKKKLTQLTFIYSANCLSPKAQAELQAFCAKYGIQPIDFDTQVLPLLTREKDIKRFHMAREEYQRACNNTGGNMAAASDNARLLIPVLEKFGHYADFDTPVNYSPAVEFANEEGILQLQAPVITNGLLAPPDLTKSTYQLQIVNDYVACSVDHKNMNKLSLDAQLAIAYVQDRIDRNYENFSKATLDPENNPHKIIDYFFDEFKGKPTVFDFRTFVNNLEYPNIHLPIIKNKEDFAKFKEILIILSVVCISGPHAYVDLYKNSLPGNANKNMGYYIQATPEYQNYLNMFRKSTLQSYPVLRACITSENTSFHQAQNVENIILHKKPIFKRASDISWAPKGEASKNERLLEMELATTNLQRIWRGHKARKALPEEGKLFLAKLSKVKQGMKKLKLDDEKKEERNDVHPAYKNKKKKKKKRNKK